VAPSQLSPRVSGRRLRGLNLRTFLIEAFGGSRVKTEHLDGQFYYPKSGIGAIMERFADACGRDRIRLNSRITRLFCSEHRIEELEINNSERFPVSDIISSLPLSILLRILLPAPPADMLEKLERIQFRNVILVALFLNRESITPNASLYFPDAKLPITRVYEPRNRSLTMSPPGKTSLVAEIPTGFESDDWLAKDQPLIECTVRQLSKLRLINESDVIGTAVYRVPFAYPVLKLGFEETVRELLEYLHRYRNLYIIGRNGEFAYTHIHDLMRVGRETIEPFIKIPRNQEHRLPASARI
jgi:protoporphyrinogen oxidase